MNFDRTLFANIYKGAMRLKGIDFQGELNTLIQSQYYDIDKLEKIQHEKVVDLIRYAVAYVPHYQQTFDGMVDFPIRGVSDLKQFPTVSKDVLKASPEMMRSRESLRGLVKKTTAGSTGEPFSLWKSSTALEKELAATWRGYSWAGIEQGDRQGRFWGVPLDKKGLLKSKAIDFLTHRRRISAFSFNDEILRQCTRELVKFRPDYLYGYVSMLVEYARFVSSHLDSPPFQLKGIVTTSEVLTSSDRWVLESTFGTKVFDEYGSAEFGAIAHECEAGSKHIAAENLIVEVLEGNRICSKDEPGELVITELSNRAMPLIRYRTGDLGTISSHPCSCGRRLPVIGSIQGRAWDMMKRKDGQLFHPAFFLYIFEEARDRNLGIEHYKVHQLAVDKFLIKIIPGRGYRKTTSEAFIRHEVKRKFDPDATIEFEIVHDIPREKSGKLRQVVGMKSSEDNSSLETHHVESVAG